MRVAIACVGLAVVLASCGSSRERGSDPRDAGPRRDAGRGDAGRVDAGPAGAFGYCAGEMPGALDACRTDGDCTDGCSDCYTPGGICGGGCPEPEPECATDADCADMGVCIPGSGCCSPATVCVPRCSPTSCPAGDRCDDATGRCEGIPCSEGFECPENTRCTPPGVAGGDRHGCARLECDGDADCDCGTCVEGRCWQRPGQCCPPLPG